MEELPTAGKNKIDTLEEKQYIFLKAMFCILQSLIDS